MNNLKDFKPQLLPNNKKGETPDLEKIVVTPENWLYSDKLDGARVELLWTRKALGRSLKLIPSVHIQQMAKDVIDSIGLSVGSIIEAEFYSPNMTFPEIMHFFRCADVTSSKEKNKLQKLWDKTGGNPDLGWQYPGRTVEWLTTWHSCLRFYAFDVININNPNTTKAVRTIALDRYVDLHNTNYESIGAIPELMMIKQSPIDHVDEIYQAYDQAIIDGKEGIVLVNKYSMYKFGRHTLKSEQIYKLKEDNLEFDGVIIEVAEGTYAREGSERTVNELGRSKTSQLKEDRVPGGYAKGLVVKMEDNKELIVSLNGFNQDEKVLMFENPSEWVGKWIRFTGMKPVKVGGVPRHAHFTKGNIRDDK